MSNYKCNLCNREFNKKNHLDNHLLKKKKPCIDINNMLPPKPAKIALESIKNPPKPAKIGLESIKNPPKSADIPPNTSKNMDQMIDLLLKEPTIDNNNKHDLVCVYCEKIFTRTDSLKKHQKARCKSKTNHDELEGVKEKINTILTNYQNLENNYQHLENNYQNLENNYQQLLKTNHIEEKTINNKTINSNNNNSNNNINNGVINTINIVQFGEEDISKLNLPEAVKQYLISTGGNIASNMLKYINLNGKSQHMYN